MFRRMDDVLETWRYESERTQAILEALPEASVGARVAEGHRDLRRLGWHLVESLLEMPGHMGLSIRGGELLDGPFIKPPEDWSEAPKAYRAASDSLLEALAGWCDADLEREDELYGETWKRGRTLFVLVVHQAHHRGQMTVLMRQAGLPVPSTYGPAKEGWGAYNLEAPAI
jgi:uncharacterized damage-inducible protein DinB